MLAHRDGNAAPGRVTFCKYDNDSAARQRGSFERVTARNLWVSSCEMVAITTNGSGLHQAVGTVAPTGSLRLQRREELRCALNGLGLGWLLELLQQRAQIASLRGLRSYGLALLAQNVLRRALKPEERSALGQIGLGE